MKIKILTLIATFLAFSSFSQVTVSASKIMKDIENGKEITYSNVTVTGDLDFTYRESKEGDLRLLCRLQKSF